MDKNKNKIVINEKEYSWDEITRDIQKNTNFISSKFQISNYSKSFLNDLSRNSVILNSNTKELFIGVSDVNSFSGFEIDSLQKIISDFIENKYSKKFKVYIDYIYTDNIFSIRDAKSDFMHKAFVTSQQSDCNKRQVGAIIVKNNKIISRGFNTAPGRLSKCKDVGCDISNKHCVRTIHAEEYAIIEALKKNEDLEGASIYITDFPCVSCAKLIIHLGIKKIFYANDYNDVFSYKLLQESKIKIERLNEEGINNDN